MTDTELEPLTVTITADLTAFNAAFRRYHDVARFVTACCRLRALTAIRPPHAPWLTDLITDARDTYRTARDLMENR